jgi:hypothetical protein
MAEVIQSNRDGKVRLPKSGLEVPIDEVPCVHRLSSRPREYQILIGVERPGCKFLLGLAPAVGSKFANGARFVEIPTDTSNRSGPRTVGASLNRGKGAS